jgi:hypothetical protein
VPLNIDGVPDAVKLRIVISSAQDFHVLLYQEMVELIALDGDLITDLFALEQHLIADKKEAWSEHDNLD